MTGCADTRACLVAIHAACFWPVWRWYFQRLNDGSDEPWQSPRYLRRCDELACARVQARGARPVVHDCRGAHSFYAALFRATAGARDPGTAVRAQLGHAPAGIDCRQSSACCLSIPLISSLQFYAGYPLRVVTAAGATEMLNCLTDIARRHQHVSRWTHRHG